MAWPTLIMIAITGVLFLLGQWFNKPEDTERHRFKDGDFPRADEGTTIPIVFGRVKLRAPVQLWYEVASAAPIKRKATIFHNNIVGWAYALNIQIGFCLAPSLSSLRSWHRVWFGGADVWPNKREKDENGDPKDTAGPILIDATTVRVRDRNLWGGELMGGGVSGTIAFYTGSGTQPVDVLPRFAEVVDVPVAYRSLMYLSLGSLRGWETTHADQSDKNITDLEGRENPVLSDGGKLVVTIGNSRVKAQGRFTNGFIVGESPNVPPISAEVQVIPSNVITRTVGGEDGPDANPAAVLWHLLRDGWGSLGIDADDIDAPSFEEAAQTLDSEAHGISLIIGDTMTAQDAIEVVLQQIDGVLYRDSASGELKLKLLRDDYNVATIPHFDESNTIDVESWDATTWEDTYNEVVVHYEDREKFYAPASVPQADWENITWRNERRLPYEITMPGVKTSALATKIAARELKVVAVPNFRGRFVFNRDGLGLVPGSVFKFSREEYGVSEMVFRVTNANTGSYEGGAVTVDAVRDKFDDSPAVSIPPPSPWVRDVLYPGAIGDRVVIESPGFWGATDPEEDDRDASHLMYMAAAPSTREATFTPEVESDDELADGTFAFIRDTSRDTSPEWAEVGTLSEPAPQESEPSGTTMTMVADSSALEVATDDEIRDGKNMVLLESGGEQEWIAYHSFTDHGSGYVTLEGVERGLLDTAQLTHAEGTRAWFADLHRDRSRIGAARFRGDEQLRARMVSSSGTANQLDDAELDTVQLRKRPQLAYPVANLETQVETTDNVEDWQRAPETLIGGDLELRWRRRDRTKTTISFGGDAAELPEAELRTSDDGQWVTVGRVELEAAANEITFDNLDGDADEQYRLTGVIVSDDNGSPAEIELRPNGLTSNQRTTILGVTANDSFIGESSSGLLIGRVSAGSDSECTISGIFDAARTGLSRFWREGRSGLHISNGTSSQRQFEGVWTDTTTKVTSLTVFRDARVMAAGSWVELEKRVR